MSLQLDLWDSSLSTSLYVGNCFTVLEHYQHEHKVFSGWMCDFVEDACPTDRREFFDALDGYTYYVNYEHDAGEPSDPGASVPTTGQH